jgi:hypothetical protein
MDHDFIHKQIESLREGARRDHTMDRIARGCWPGGAEDRTEPAALKWVRQWRPATFAASLPACSCTAGKCRICN